MPPSNQEPVWILGPARAKLGDFATIDVPEGYRYTDARGAWILLRRMRNPVPRDLAGLLAPDSGKWWVVVDCADLGYVRGLNEGAQVDAASTLRWIEKRLALENQRRARSGASPIAGLDWAMAPAFDARNCVLEWALRVQTTTDKIVDLQQETETNSVVNHTIRLLGKRWSVGLTVVQPEQVGAGSIPLGELIKAVSFNPGERYADFKVGDKLAQLSLDEIIVGEKRRTQISPYVSAGIWSGAAVFALALAGAGFLLIRRRFRRMQRSRAYPDYAEHDQTLARLFVNGKSRSSNGGRRRRVFNYQKYYADMMLEVSSGPTVLHPAPNGKRVAQAAPRPATPAAADPGINQTLVLANLDLIANQNRLIEEQKRLLQEQGKLIEEKSKLIQEKTRLLEQQAEFLERDLL